MKKLIVVATLALTATSALADTSMKPGLWEVQSLKQIMDGQDMTAQMAAAQQQMQQMLASMPPAQRKQMEQSMGTQAAPSNNAQRICISPEMAAQDKAVTGVDTRCEPTSQQRSGNRISFELKCPTITGKGESTISGDTVTSKMDMVTTEGGQRHTMQSESQMKYLGADCKGIKPADQLVREMQEKQRR
jgi:hypothetical protein